MAENDLDPGASTQMFRAFVEREKTPPSDPRTNSNKRFLVVGLLLVAAAAVAIGLAFLQG